VDTARRLACDAGLIPAVLGAASERLDVGRLRRLVTPAIRRALNLRDGGCRFPGCDRPVAWCDAHHLLSWIQGGQTCLANMILLCRRHHVLVHEYDWSIRLDHHTGVVTAHDPTGRPLDLVSHPRAHSP
jgi:HNH endonuclease